MIVSRKQQAAIVMPFLLVPSTALVFKSAARGLNPEAGYVLGFLFYWVVWCLLVPVYLLGRSGLAALFRGGRPLFVKSNWTAAGLLLLVVGITLLMYPPARLVAAESRLLLLAIPLALINGIGEEIAWRGVYVKLFPGSALLGVLYPALGFALWHWSPQLLVPAGIGVWPFIASTFFLGASYGWISYRTGTIRWNAFSHSLGGILDLGGAIAPALLAWLTD